jgi:hypothetical protein
MTTKPFARFGRKCGRALRDLLLIQWMAYGCFASVALLFGVDIGPPWLLPASFLGAYLFALYEQYTSLLA